MVKPVYKGHSKEPQTMPFINMLKLYAPNSLMGKNETVVYREGFGI
jgi:hypothetical protein